MHFFLCKGRCHEFLFPFSVFETSPVWDISQFEMFDDELVLFQNCSYFSITVLQRTMRIRIQINEKYAENTYKNIINLLKQRYWWKIHAHLFVAEDWGKPTKKVFRLYGKSGKIRYNKCSYSQISSKSLFFIPKKSNKSKASKLLTHK